LDGYGAYQSDISWRIEAKCQSLLITSTVFDLEPGRTYLYIGEGDRKTTFTGDSEISHTTDAGDVTISFYSNSYSYREWFKK
jgi:hypothetical protein